MDLVQRLNSACLDKDNFPRMDSERWLPVGLAKEAANEIERLRAALKQIIDNEYQPLGTVEIARAALRQKEK